MLRPAHRTESRWLKGRWRCGWIVNFETVSKLCVEGGMGVKGIQEAITAPVVAFAVLTVIRSKSPDRRARAAWVIRGWTSGGDDQGHLPG